MSETAASATAQEKPESKTARSSKKRVQDVSLNMEELRELADLVDEHGFTDFEFENENIRVRLSKTVSPPMTQAPVAYAPSSTAPPQINPTSSAAARGAETSKPAVSEDEDLYKITSPIVGTFYRSAGPDKEPYVSEGSKVTPETIVCIVEAMKLMNEIQAETNGEVVKVYIENGQPVEYGQPLFGIRK